MTELPPFTAAKADSVAVRLVTSFRMKDLEPSNPILKIQNCGQLWSIDAPWSLYTSNLLTVVSRPFFSIKLHPEVAAGRPGCLHRSGYDPKWLLSHRFLMQQRLRLKHKFLSHHQRSDPGLSYLSFCSETICFHRKTYKTFGAILSTSTWAQVSKEKCLRQWVKGQTNACWTCTSWP